MTTDQPPFRAGYVAIIGMPNVGKSTLLNAFLQQKISIVTPKAQTTNQAIRGIYNAPLVQMVFVDTPGWLDPKDAYQSAMKKSIVRPLFDEADAVLWVIAPVSLGEADKRLGENIRKAGKPVVVIINKTDVPGMAERAQEIKKEVLLLLGDQTKVSAVSAKTGQGIPALRDHMISLLPLGAPYFPTDQVTDHWERFFVSEFIREQLFHQFREEVPHATAVVVDEFREREGQKDYVKVILNVETEGQKRIVIGLGGREIRKLGEAARREIESQIGRPIFLELAVKIKKNWRKDTAFLEKLQEPWSER